MPVSLNCITNGESMLDVLKVSDGDLLSNSRDMSINMLPSTKSVHHENRENSKGAILIKIPENLLAMIDTLKITKTIYRTFCREKHILVEDRDFQKITRRGPINFA